MQRNEFVDFLNNLIKLSDFPDDISNNGLQVEGGEKVMRAAFGVDASLAMAEFALKNKCDFIFVHHGISWQGGIRRITGPVAAQLKILLGAGISLYAAHLPLDAHPEFGNNAGLAAMCGLSDTEPLFNAIGRAGILNTPVAIRHLADILGEKLKCVPSVYGDSGREVRRVYIVSGHGGSDALQDAVSYHADLLITGEMDHIMYHPAAELNLPVIALGHYASEQPGPQSVMKEVEKRCGIECLWADLPTGL